MAPQQSGDMPEPYRILEVDDPHQRLEIAVKIIKALEPNLSDAIIHRDVEIIRDTDNPIRLGPYILTILGTHITVQVENKFNEDIGLNRYLQETVDKVLNEKKRKWLK